MKTTINQAVIKKLANVIGKAKGRIHVRKGNGKTTHMIEYANRMGYAIIYC